MSRIQELDDMLRDLGFEKTRKSLKKIDVDGELDGS